MSASVIAFNPDDRLYYSRFFCISRHVEVFAKILVMFNGLGIFGMFFLVIFERKSLALWFPVLEVFDFILLLHGILAQKMYSILFCIAYRAVNIMFLLSLVGLQLIFGYTDLFIYEQDLLPRAIAICCLLCYALYKLYSLKIFGNLLGFYAMRDEFQKSRQSASQRSGRGGEESERLKSLLII